MIPWNLVTPQEHFALVLSLFFVLCVQLWDLIRTFEYHKTKIWRLNAVGFALLFAFLAALYDRSIFLNTSVWLLWLGVAASIAWVAVFTAYSVRKYKYSITRSSIKEAMDDLPVAGCYFTEHGTVKLCNKQMYILCYTLYGRDLQTLAELHEALDNAHENGIGRTYDGGYVFPDGRVWYYIERKVVADDGKSYTESVFTDCTELFAVNEELMKDNKELERINGKLQKMYARAEDRVREREYLSFKMKIHDDIGKSLTVIRNVLTSDWSEVDIEKQIKTLSLVAGTLVYSPKNNSDDYYDQLLNFAAELGVEVKLDGMLPMEPLIYELVIKAVKQCVTNCVRHAHGSTVFVRIVGLSGGYSVTITNDGNKPKEKITEGGGLSNLRQSIENAGGEMAISHYPQFVLRLILMREEMEL